MRFRASEARFVDANEGGFGDLEPASDAYIESSMNNSEFDEDF